MKAEYCRGKAALVVIVSVAVVGTIAGGAYWFLSSDETTSPGVGGSNERTTETFENIGTIESATVETIPEEAEIVYHDGINIFVSDRTGSFTEQLTDTEGRNWEHVSVSPGHRYLVANEWVRIDGIDVSRVFLFDLMGGTEIQLLADFVSAGEGGVEWNPTGILYLSATEVRGGSADLYEMRVDGTGLTKITNTLELDERDVSVSKDGTKIIFMGGTEVGGGLIENDIYASFNDGNGQVLLRRANQPTRLRVGGVSDPEYSPDAETIVYSEENYVVTPLYTEKENKPELNTAHDLWTMNADGSGRMRLTSDEGNISIAPSWQGDEIIYTHVSRRGNTPVYSIGAIKADGSERRRMLEGGRYAKWIP